jgi:hypothetical protein
MVGWQKIKEMHFQKHSETATFHPIYGWQAGPQTPNLRLILMLGGEVNDIDEFQLNIFEASWAFITILLMGSERCPHHHRHASRLRQMADLTPHVSFVEAQGLVAERFVTHELLKLHLGQDLSMAEFENLEQHMAELPSPLEPPMGRPLSGRSHLNEMITELPGLEETRTWQTDQIFPRAPDLHELPDDPRPAELPNTEIPTAAQRPPRPTRSPPSPPQSEQPFDPPPPYLENE